MRHCEVDKCLNVPRCTIEASYAVSYLEPRDADPDEGYREIHAVLCTEHARLVSFWAARVEVLPVGEAA